VWVSLSFTYDTTKRRRASSFTHHLRIVRSVVRVSRCVERATIFFI